MISFSWTILEDQTVEVRIKTPVVRVGTLHRLTAAIYVLGLDIVSGDVDTVEEPDGLYSSDLFILRMDDFTRGERGTTGTLDGEFSARLGVLMESLLSREGNPDELLRERGYAPPDKSFLFDNPPEVVFQDHPESNWTQFYIETVNRSGLLFHLTRILYSEQINIIRATIRTTPDGMAQDTFYLNQEEKILGHEVSDRLESLILGRIQG